MVRHGSLTAAGAALQYTTSAVSQQIAALERETGTRLLIRGPNGARPTPAGEKLLKHAERILAAVDLAERDLCGSTEAGREQIRLTSFSSVSTSLLPKMIREIRRIRPMVDVEILTADPDDGVALLNSGQADATVITEVPDESRAFPQLFTAPVFDDEFYVVLPPSHPMSSRREVSLAALATERWIVSSATGDCPDTRVFRKACAAAGVMPEVSYRQDDYGAVQAMVAVGLGVSLVPSLAVGAARHDVTVRRVSGSRPIRRISIALREKPAEGSATNTLVSALQQVGAAAVVEHPYSNSARPLSMA